MELIYMHIKNFNNLIFDQEINFSNRNKVRLEKNFKKEISLKIEKIDNLTENFYGENIKNITLLLGKNGRGKTSLMDILGMKENDRNCEGIIKSRLIDLFNIEPNDPNQVIREYEEENLESDNYMLVYKLFGDKYFIEIHGNYYVSRINNVDWRAYHIDIHDKLTGFILKKNGDKFKIINQNLISEDRIYLPYITKNKSNRLISPYDIRDYNDSWNLVNRNYRYKSGHSIAYDYAHIIMKENINLDFNNKNFNISIEYREQDFNDLKIEDKINQDDYLAKVKSLKTFLYFYSDNYDEYEGEKYFKINNLNKSDRELANIKNNRDKFILGFLSYNIMDMVLNSLYDKKDRNISGIILFKKDMSTFRMKKIEKNKKIFKIKVFKQNMNIFKSKNIISENEFNNFINQLCKNVTYMNSTKLLGVSLNFGQEMYYLKKAMEQIYSKNIKEYKKLIYICRYLHSRIDSKYKIGRHGAAYQDSIEDIVEQLLLIKKSYFTKDKLIYKFNKKDEKFHELLKIYDKYTKPTNDEINSSELGRTLDIKYNNLSEGQKTLFSIYTLLFEELKDKKDKDLTIFLLDEPDQSLHPEWSRIFINEICKEIDKYNTNVQLIITTHSPFIVSDVISQNVCLLMSKQEYEDITSKKTKHDIEIRTLNDLDIGYNTFASNIYEILKLGFVLNRTIGEFAYSKITNWINDINKSEDIDSLKKINKEHIELIGEKVIRDKIIDLYKNKQEEIRQEKIKDKKILLDMVREFIVEEEEYKLNILENLIIELKRGNKND